MSNLQKALKAIEGEHFYEQGSTAKFAYSITPLPGCLSMRKKHGVSFKVTVSHVKNSFSRWFHNLEGLAGISEYYLKLLQTEDVMKKTEEEWWPVSDELRSFCEDVIEGKYDGADLNTLLEALQRIGDLGTRHWESSVFIDGFDPHGEDIITEAVLKLAPALEPEIALLVTPKEHSYVRRERLSILSIALLPKEEIDEALKRHQKKYYWYRTSFGLCQNLDENHFREELREIQEKGDAQQERDELQDMSIVEKRDVLLASAPPDLQRLLRFFRWMTVLRDHRKETCSRTLTAMRRLYENISEATDISVDLLEYMAYWEGKRISDEGFVETLQKRQEGVAVIIYDDERIILEGKDSQELLAAIEEEVEHENEVVGKTACPGTVQGTVKIVNHASDFSKVEKGDILISAMTRPEFMPVLKLAGAIVTNDGGVTCHAAIVSRELKLPCVIGARNATKIFKDGDKVEVDADKGVVRKL